MTTDFDIDNVIVGAQQKLRQIEDEIVRATQQRDSATESLKELKRERTKWSRVVRAYHGSDVTAPATVEEPEAADALRARVHEESQTTISPSVAQMGESRHTPVAAAATPEETEVLETSVHIENDEDTPVVAADTSFFPDVDDTDY